MYKMLCTVMCRYPKWTIITWVVLIGVFGAGGVWLGGILQSTQGDTEDYLDAYLVEGFRACYNLSSEKEDPCLKEFAALLTDTYEVASIGAAVRRTMDREAVYAKCHTFSHFVGWEAYDATTSPRAALDTVGYSCWGGMMHGVMERHFMQTGRFGVVNEPEAVRSLTRDLCGTFASSTTYRRHGECIHGVGHGLMFLTSNDVPKSLQMCDTLAERERPWCYWGVFMENAWSATNDDHISAYFRPDNLAYPCAQLPQRYKNICYQNQSAAALRTEDGFDFVAMQTFCSEVPQAYQRPCFTNLGISAVMRTSDAAQMQRICRNVRSRAGEDSAGRYRACVSGVVHGINGRFGGDAQRIDAFCRRLDGDELRRQCYRDAGGFFGQWVSTESARRARCRMLGTATATRVCIEDPVTSQYVPASFVAP